MVARQRPSVGLEFTVYKGVWHSVAEGRVAKIPGGEAVGKCWVMFGLEVGMPGREAMNEHWKYVWALSTWLIGLLYTNILSRK